VVLRRTGFKRKSKRDSVTMKVEIADILLFVLFFQLLSIAPFFLFQKTQNRRANQILGAFFLAKALCISHFLVMRLIPYSTTRVPHLFYVGSSFTILWGPLLYFYVRAMTHREYHFKRRDSLHLLPFLVHLVYVTFKFHIQDVETKISMIASYAVFPGPVHTLVYGYFYISLIIYTVASIRLILKYRLQIKNTLSSLGRQQLSWLGVVLIGFSLKWILDVWYFLGYTLFHVFLDGPVTASLTVLYIYLSILMYKALSQPQLFTGIEVVQEKKKISLSKTMSADYARRLSDFMDAQKPFYDPDMTLYDLAEKTGIPPRSLSEVINTVLGKNFYEYVNSYRIRESQKLLSESRFRRKTVLEVLYEVGFNSKSSFNMAFKKTTGMTPLEFRRQQG
jgi:AraC-like DNA-binding protein